jgi:hypothetical protein
MSVVQIIVGMARQLVREKTLGMELGHDELTETIEDFLARIPGGKTRLSGRGKPNEPASPLLEPAADAPAEPAPKPRRRVAAAVERG